MKTVQMIASSALLSALLVAACGDDEAVDGDTSKTYADAGDAGASGDAGVSKDPVKNAANRMIDEGRETFRFDTFGDEVFWGDTLKLHEAIAGISPTAALELGLKVDVEALPAEVVAALTAGEVDLTSPATTILLLKANAVVGVTGIFDDAGTMTSIGLQCALCHSTVDDSLVPGIGKRRDGWANRDLNVGAIVSAAPDLSAVTTLLNVDEVTLKAVLASWGPGKFDAEVFLDGKGLRPDGTSAAVLIPAAFGLSGVNLHTYTGWGSVTYWNAFVANLELHGQGTFYDPRLDDALRFPIAAENGFGNVRSPNDLITPKLAALHFYQLALEAPKPPASNYDTGAAERGAEVFNTAGKCATCHVPPLFTEPGWNMHTAEEIGIDDFQAQRSPDVRYRTTPLKGLWTHTKGGFYHDGRFATLADVIYHYDTFMELELTAEQKSDLEQYLMSL